MDVVLVVGLIAAWLALVLLGLMTYQLILQNGRMLGRIEELQETVEPWDGTHVRISEYTGMLPIGGEAPPISQPDLDGVPHTLSEWRGRRVLLVFVDPRCTFSRTLLPYLVAMASDVVPGRPMPVLISTGDLDENRALFDASGFANPVLLQKDREAAVAYKVDATPASYLIDADGTIASKLMTGVQWTLILAGEMASVTDATDTLPETRPLETGRLVREGLAAGATAPVFRLPRIDGGELSLLEYRGKPVVVVFSDPKCAPCDELAPKLEDAHRRHPELTIVMIGRGDPEANQAMAAKHELSFPIVMQRHWEISREYGIFATPVAFLVDEWGVIATDVADGPAEIVKLVTKAAADGGSLQ